MLKINKELLKSSNESESVREDKIEIAYKKIIRLFF